MMKSIRFTLASLLFASLAFLTSARAAIAHPVPGERRELKSRASQDLRAAAGEAERDNKVIGF